MDKTIGDYVNYIRSKAVKGVYDGSINLFFRRLNYLPDFSDLTITGSFLCHYNNLTSLKGSPKCVGGDYCCYYNCFRTLEGLPEYIGGKFKISKDEWSKIDPNSSEYIYLALNNKLHFT